ncbi:cupredoxin domain-containing protein [Psychromonas sp. L1A2]|uniref:cupredoxin domain-containing protein n=1 Tax=Psychromonas sp. L1A2 TaxID=2686356 RepID=UPI00135A7139|nr:cupredoxin domain-containing protein [Psychromonas sp. L1A2]
MKLFRHVLLFSFVAVMAVNSFVIASETPNTSQLDADGFSVEMNDPRYTKLKTYLVEMKDGVLTPTELVVPEKTKFRLVVRNLGNKPAEFESNQLRQEKVLFMNAETTLVIIPLDAGTYDYFDDFAPTTHGKIIVKAKD